MWASISIYFGSILEKTRLVLPSDKQEMDESKLD